MSGGAEPAAGADWRLERSAGVWVVRCSALEGIPGVGHAFSSRRWGDDRRSDPLDPAGAQAREDPIRRRGRALCRAAGLGDVTPDILRQVHGVRVLRSAELAGGASAAGGPEGDGIVALRGEAPRRALSVRTADCVAVLLAEREGAAVGALHAGWRGTAGGLVGRAVRRLEALGVPARRLVVALGPAIGPCCYVVGSEVLDAVARSAGVPEELLARTTPEGVTVDLRAALTYQLARAGVDPSAIRAAPWCTACRPEWFDSYRRDGAGAGRLIAVIGWRADGGSTEAGLA